MSHNLESLMEAKRLATLERIRLQFERGELVEDLKRLDARIEEQNRKFSEADNAIAVYPVELVYTKAEDLKNGMVVVINGNSFVVSHTEDYIGHPDQLILNYANLGPRMGQVVSRSQLFQAIS
jgi:hypothetical protein